MISRWRAIPTRANSGSRPTWPGWAMPPRGWSPASACYKAIRSMALAKRPSFPHGLGAASIDMEHLPTGQVRRQIRSGRGGRKNPGHRRGRLRAICEARLVAQSHRHRPFGSRALDAGAGGTRGHRSLGTAIPVRRRPIAPADRQSAEEMLAAPITLKLAADGMAAELAHSVAANGADVRRRGGPRRRRPGLAGWGSSWQRLPSSMACSVTT